MMRCAPAMPINHLMPAASARVVPVATPLFGGLPRKIERPHLRCPHVGHPSMIMLPDIVRGPRSGWAPARAMRLPSHIYAPEGGR